MKDLSQFIIESTSTDFEKEIIKFLNRKFYDEIAEKLSEAEKNRTFKFIEAGQIKNLDTWNTLYGVNDRTNSFIIAIYIPKIRGVNCLIYDGKKESFENKWQICSSWNDLLGKIAKYKFKFFAIEEPNREIREEIYGGLAKFEKYD